MHEDFSRRHTVAPASDRSFGFVMAGAFGVLAAVSWWRSGTPSTWAMAISLAFLAFAAIRPSVLRPIAGLWIQLGLVLHRIMTPVVLGVMFFMILTPVARLARVFGHVWLPLEKQPDAGTYWNARPTKVSSMKNQF